MTTLAYGDHTYSVENGQSILNALEAAGVPVKASCRNGVCQTCMMKVTQGTLPEKSQQGLKETEKAAGYFLPCVCYPTENLTITDANNAPRYDTSILSITNLNHDIIEVKLAHPEGFIYRAGQYIQVYKDPFQVRTYSLASVPAKNEPLTLQVRIIPNGLISEWLKNLSVGDKITIAGPFGDCFYTDNNKSQPIIMIGTGSGLSPLYGILHDALLNQHEGSIHLFHGAVDKNNLYKERELRELSANYHNFNYIPCLSEEISDTHEHGMVLDVALRTLSNYKGTRLFLCGHPEMVKMAKRKMFLAGVAFHNIYADPFG